MWVQMEMLEEERGGNLYLLFKFHSEILFFFSWTLSNSLLHYLIVHKYLLYMSVLIFI